MLVILQGSNEGLNSSLKDKIDDGNSQQRL